MNVGNITKSNQLLIVLLLVLYLFIIIYYFKLLIENNTVINNTICYFKVYSVIVRVNDINFNFGYICNYSYKLYTMCEKIAKITLREVFTF